ncbi:MBL fold metallo-hydrolase [Georgenia subflava]|uniref:MBL fold metallo-hydrolase n=1 Tax=Georgenia subflava TaxID=1622177 RepID=A0A6N7EBI5_9MICO|nr:MBL fold metallo-hydrolase [Georgenia subflava]MPV35762.1 MBL fold metallo-hydrolase [Georgenia subflava]
MTVWICHTCAVEHADTDVPPTICRICTDERQWVPATGQAWTTLTELQELGHRTVVREVEPGLLGVTAVPQVGIGQQALVVTTPAGNLLWDPIGFLDDDGVRRVREAGPVVAIAASHPHMFGVQVAWSRALGGVPVLVNEADREWLARPDDAVQYWSGRTEPVPGVVLHQIGGHFPGNTVVTWTGADGTGVLLCGDTIGPNPDRTTVAFMRSYPNRIPLSGAVTERVARSIEELDFDRIYGNFGNAIPRDGKAAVRRSADRHVAWVRGDHDDET